MTNFLFSVRSIIWGIPTMVLLIGIGFYFTVSAGFPQVVFFRHAISRCFTHPHFRQTAQGEVSPFQALCTALAATVGTGNIAGVAGAICLGGPGAVFWLWFCGFLGMATKYAESVLALRYRVCSESGCHGGPMYMITQGMPHAWHWMALLYSLLGIFACFGIGTLTQVNTVVTGIRDVFSQIALPLTNPLRMSIGFLFAGMVLIVQSGGAYRIGKLSEICIPIVSACYIVLCLCLIFCNIRRVPAVFSDILCGAFSPKAITGGTIGSMFKVMQTGCSRGLFTNEAGMGTASIAHASAAVSHPVEQGLMGLTEVFLDTHVICTLTAFAILCSGIPIPYGFDSGAQITVQALATLYGEAAAPLLTFCLCCFSAATILGWGLYGIQCAAFLFGPGSVRKFIAIQAAVAAAGAVIRTPIVWCIAEIVNGLMIYPNLIALAALSSELRKLTNDYKRNIKLSIP